MQSESVRLEGIERWQGWFSDHLSSRLAVEELGWRGAAVGAVWKVRFPGAGEGKVYVALEALLLDGEDFRGVASTLDPVELVTRLRTHSGRVLRIRRDGRMEMLG